jgi:hypothetical protein
MPNVVQGCRFTIVYCRWSGRTAAETPAEFDSFRPIRVTTSRGYLMSFQLKDVLSAIGPRASIVFAAWIFMSFLQNRYSSAFQLYRELIEQFRTRGKTGTREENVRDQVLLFKRRFELMRLATNLGLLAAILLIATLIGGALNVVFGNVPVIAVISTIAAITGFLLVIVAACVVIRENSIIRRAVTVELLDVPELAELAGQQAGSIRDPGRKKMTGHNA